MSCSQLTSVDFPNATYIGDSAFNNCNSLTSIDLPNVTSMGDWVFEGCNSLTSIDLPENITSIGSYAFNSCSNLSTVIISTNQIITLGDKWVFYNTPIENGSGYIYVPDSLVSSYRSASNWSTYSAQNKSVNELA